MQDSQSLMAKSKWCVYEDLEPEAGKNIPINKTRQVEDVTQLR